MPAARPRASAYSGGCAYACAHRAGIGFDSAMAQANEVKPRIFPRRLYAAAAIAGLELEPGTRDPWPGSIAQVERLVVQGRLLLGVPARPAQASVELDLGDAARDALDRSCTTAPSPSRRPTPNGGS